MTGNDASGRVRERFAAAKPHRIGQSYVSAAAVPVQLRWPGLHRLVISQAEGAACFFGQAYLVAGRHVQTYGVYYDCKDEFVFDPDSFITRKIVWRDEATGYDCIVMRSPDDRLRGFVGVPDGHAAHGLSCAELQARCGDGAFDPIFHADRGSLCAERRSSLAEEARSVSNRMLELRRHPESFRHVISLKRDTRWWFGLGEGSSTAALLHNKEQPDLPFPPTFNPPLDDEASAFLRATRLAMALRRMDPRRRRSD